MSSSSASVSHVPPDHRGSALLSRAQAAIPGGMYGHLDRRGLADGYPQFFSRGEGARIWDVDGNEYIDFMCSWGPIVLGHGAPRVEAAARDQMRRGDCLNGPTAEFVELAERFASLVDHARWAMLCKNGTDATSLALRIAREATGRERVLVARRAYHGAAAWCVPGGAGVTAGERSSLSYFEFNDVASLEAALAESAEPIAAVIVCPIRHDMWSDVELVTPEFARAARALCDREGAALVLDEVRCGVRLDLRGSWAEVGVEPDLSAWSKAIANGYALAAVLGSESLREAAARTYATGSFWYSAVPVVAALATLAEVEESDAIERMRRAGTRLMTGLNEQAAAHGLRVTTSGPPQLPFMRFDDDPDWQLGRRWAGACARRGVYVHPGHNWFLSAAHGEAEIDQALRATDEAFAELAGAIER